MNDYDNERKDYQRAIELNENDPAPFYYLALSYFEEKKLFLSQNYLSSAINNLISNPAYEIETISDDNISLKELYMFRGAIYKTFNSKELMCFDFKKACDLGDCEMFNENCK